MIPICEKDYEYLLKLAKVSIEHGFKHGTPIVLNAEDVPPQFHQTSEMAVSIKSGNKNLGCISNAYRPMAIYEAVINNAFDAAFNDNMFKPVKRNALTKATIIVSRLLQKRRYVKITSFDSFCSTIKTNESVVLHLDTSSELMLSFMHKYYADPQKFMNALREKSEMHKKMPWDQLTATVIETVLSREVPYNEIPWLT